MTSSLPSYDLSRLFSGSGSGSGHMRHASGAGGGEALVEEALSSRDISSASDSDLRGMTDSLSTVSWDTDINDDHEDNDESRD